MALSYELFRMKLMNCFRWLLLAACLVAPLQAEDVVISKGRLEELERKEKELESLKSELRQSRGEQEKLQREKEKAEAGRQQAEQEKRQLSEARAAAEAKAAAAQAVAARAEPVIVHDTPPLASLPPLRKDDVVDAMDLMNHYRADAAAAAQRYGKKRLRLRGVVTGFEKPLFVSPYVILLQSTERSWRVVCQVNPPRELKATFPAKRGETLVGVTTSGARLTLLRVGQTVEIEAECRGLKAQNLSLSGGRLMLAE